MPHVIDFQAPTSDVRIYGNHLKHHKTVGELAMGKAKKEVKKERVINVAIVGANGVGKSRWAGTFHGTYPGYYNQWSDHRSLPRQSVEVDGEVWHVEMHDLVLKPLWEAERDISIEYWDSMLTQVHGVILLYDITDRKSYDSVTKADYPTILSFRERPPLDERSVPEANPMDEELRLGRFRRFGGLLVGNKHDLVKERPLKREVSKSLAQEWASMHGMKHFEGNTFEQKWLISIVRDLIGQIMKAELRDKEDLEQRDRYEAALKPDETSATHKPNGLNRLSTLSRSFLKMRNALPRVPLKNKETAPVAQPIEEKSQWSMFLSSNQPPAATN
ncbi:hypothetical protein DM02DRAFT_623988 [Periconia macrospinosa]|uniref:small monomeric GTPase n=1 Tax=Periconia macrospinosa TaxID=97972 RepID=A0A2V1E538_9PLEO|nr:hypothetical protein DM02DRAFT_623988 [Periconia macrospinosa]